MTSFHITRCVSHNVRTDTLTVEPSSEYLDLLADRIADGLDAILPPGAPSTESTVWLFESNVRMNLAPDETPEATIAAVAERLLDRVQDDMTMFLTVPWPEVPDKPLGYFAAPRADVVGDTLRLWFEVDGEAVGAEVVVSLLPEASE